MENIIEVKNLKKYYGNVKAVDDISFEVEKGTLFAFLGINGAGKSTTINMLCSICFKDEGEILIGGLNIDKDRNKIKNRIGIVFQSSVLDTMLTVKDNLKSRAAFYGITGNKFKQRLQYLTDLFDLKDILNRTFGKLSGGQKRRVDIARALLHEPEILFLDEPTTGLDPQTRVTVWNVINKLRAEGLTVFLTTHYMEESANADTVVIIDNGKIVARDTPNALKKQYTKDYVKIYDQQNESTDKLLQKENLKYEYHNNAYFIIFENCDLAKNFIVKHEKIIADFEVIKGDMDDVFLNVTGKKLVG